MLINLMWFLFLTVVSCHRPQNDSACQQENGSDDTASEREMLDKVQPQDEASLGQSVDLTFYLFI